MLRINQLQEFVAECKAEIDEINSAKVIITIEDLSKIMNDHATDDNILMIGIVPEHDISGHEDSSVANNGCGFYFLEKTDYSDVTQDGYLSVFVRTQEVALKFITKVLADKAEGNHCGLFQLLSDNTIQVSPVKALSSCNGYFVSLDFNTYI